jgi:hypothetical protein
LSERVGVCGGALDVLVESAVSILDGDGLGDTASVVGVGRGREGLDCGELVSPDKIHS